MRHCRYSPARRQRLNQPWLLQFCSAFPSLKPPPHAISHHRRKLHKNFTITLEARLKFSAPARLTRVLLSATTARLGSFKREGRQWSLTPVPARLRASMQGAEAPAAKRRMAASVSLWCVWG
jgi:hypothetical protein